MNAMLVCLFRRLVTIGAVASFMFALLIDSGVPTVAAADTSCNCVAWVQSRTGLSGGPRTAAGYTESVMNQKGYKRVTPQAGAILIWDANQKLATGDGHMAIISSARYDNATKKWLIRVQHANWGGCGIRDTPFSWGDLYGVNAYVRK